MTFDWADRDRDDLLAELDSVEKAIRRSRSFRRTIDGTGQIHVRVSAELMALAEREHSILTELSGRVIALRTSWPELTVGPVQAG